MYVKDEQKSKSNVDLYAERARDKIRDMKDRLEDANPGDGDHVDHPMASVRKAMHRGKHIVVETHYKITIDEKPFGAHLGVANDGNVHYHGLPNYAFASMMDLVRKVIDASEAELPEDQISQAGGEN